MNTHGKTVVFGLAALSAMAHAGEVLTRPAGSAWQDGLLVGDGATAALVYAPAHLPGPDSDTLAWYAIIIIR